MGDVNVKEILIGAAVVWCIGFAVIAGLSIRKYWRRRAAFEKWGLR